MIYDVCIIGSGVGGSGVAYTLAMSGKKVVVLERGLFYREKDFSKDEIAYCKRDIITPNLKESYHTIESLEDEKWIKTATYDSENSFFNGNVVGGSSNFMSGYFHRFKPNDFRLKSTYPEIKGANIMDWVIDYSELEPYYEKVERLVGISGEVTPHKYHEPRSTPNFPYPPLDEHPISKLIDKSCHKLGFIPYKTPRAIISKPKDKRDNCYYSNYCGSYGCSSGAKGSARVSLLEPALKSGNLTIITSAFVKKLEEKNKKVTKAIYIDTQTLKEHYIKAKIFVVANQAVESCRLLLNSKSLNFPNGLANNSNQVGKNILFSAGGVGSGGFDFNSMPIDELMKEGLFVNRSLCDWYEIDGVKGGIIDLLFEHANPISKAIKERWQDGELIWGEKLQDKIFYKFTKTRRVNFEIFNDWLPNDNCFVSVDDKYRDIYGVPVANIRIGSHPHNLKIANILAQKAKKLLIEMGAKDINISISPYPPSNLQAGGCRFGDNPQTSVLNKYCQTHEIKNLFVTDGSFMPTGGSLPYTWTIYANSFRVGEYILNI